MLVSQLVDFDMITDTGRHLTASSSKKAGTSADEELGTMEGPDAAEDKTDEEGGEDAGGLC